MKIFWAAWLLLMGVPLLVASIVRADTPAGVFVLSTAMVAAGIGLVWEKVEND